MEYIKVRVTIEPYNEIAGELLIAEMGDLGYDSFCESDTGFDAYIPSKNYVKADLNSIQAPVITSYSIHYTKLYEKKMTILMNTKEENDLSIKQSDILTNNFPNFEFVEL